MAENSRDDLGAGGLRLEREGSIGWLYIDRPHARNAFTPAMYWGIKKAVHLVNADPDLAALIITGTGDVFAPGGDLAGRVDPGESLHRHPVLSMSSEPSYIAGWPAPTRARRR